MVIMYIKFHYNPQTIRGKPNPFIQDCHTNQQHGDSHIPSQDFISGGRMISGELYVEYFDNNALLTYHYEHGVCNSETSSLRQQVQLSRDGGRGGWRDCKQYPWKQLNRYTPYDTVHIVNLVSQKLS